MPVDIDPATMPVLLLYNLDPGWSSQETDEALAATDQLVEKGDVHEILTFVKLEPFGWR